MATRMSTRRTVPTYRAHVSGRVSPVSRPASAMLRSLAWMVPMGVALWALLVWVLQLLLG